MNSLAAYGSDSDNEDIKRKLPNSKINLAPSVNTLVKSLVQTKSEGTYIHNLKLSEMLKPIQGPANPFSVSRAVQRNTLNGYVEDHHMDPEAFKTMERTFLKYGYTVDPNAESNEIIGDLGKAASTQGILVSDSKEQKKDKRKRVKGGDVDSESWKGPWAGFEGETIVLEPRIEEEIIAPVVPVVVEVKPKVTGETSVFHGPPGSERDYLGRSYLHAPRDLDVNLYKEGVAGQCYVPKSLIHTWTGHTKGVNAIRFFPKTAHLLLSGSMDSKVKLWDAYHDRRCLRTFSGHTNGVRDVSFSPDGSQFLSASFDKFIKLWDTETGQCLNRFELKKAASCIEFHPDKEYSFLAGCADNKIYQYDIRTNQVIQTYDNHFNVVNTITFFDEGRKFVSTSDDKTMRAYEFGTPVQIKYVSESDLHSMPAVTLSPDGKWILCQSLDNTLLTFSTHEKLKLNRKKAFRGHLVAGYACKPGWSPDGRYVISGDSEGILWIWDYKTGKISKKIKAHEAVIMSTIWHPHETSKVATASWDGTIKLWD